MNNNVKDFDVATICVPVFFCDDYSPFSLSLIKPITLIRQYAYSNYLVWNKPDIQAYQKKKECKIYTVSRRCLEFQKNKQKNSREWSGRNDLKSGAWNGRGKNFIQ